MVLHSVCWLFLTVLYSTVLLDPGRRSHSGHFFSLLAVAERAFSGRNHNYSGETTSLVTVEHSEDSTRLNTEASGTRPFLRQLRLGEPVFFLNPHIEPDSLTFCII